MVLRAETGIAAGMSRDGPASLWHPNNPYKMHGSTKMNVASHARHWAWSTTCIGSTHAPTAPYALEERLNGSG